MSEVRTPYYTRQCTPSGMPPTRALALALLCLDRQLELERIVSSSPRYSDLGRELAEARQVLEELKARLDHSGEAGLVTILG